MFVLLSSVQPLVTSHRAINQVVPKRIWSLVRHREVNFDKQGQMRTLGPWGQSGPDRRYRIQ